MTPAIAAAELHVPVRRLVGHALDRCLERDHAAAVFQIAPQRQHETVAVDDAGFRRPQRADAGQFLLHGARRVAADHLDAFDAVLLRLRHDGLDLGELGVVGGHDQLAAFAVADAVGGAEVVEHAPAAHAELGAQRVGRIIKAGVDHFAVARRHAVGDAAGDFGNRHVMAGECRGARDRKPDDTGADDKDFHQSRFHGTTTRSISLSSTVSTKPMIAIMNRPTYICSTENVSQAVQIM